MSTYMHPPQQTGGTIDDPTLALRIENAALKKRVAWLEEVTQTQMIVINDQRRKLQIRAISNKKLSPAEKLFVDAAQDLTRAEKPNERGLVRLDVGKAAEMIGASEDSGSRLAKKICERFGATHETVPYTTRSGQKCKLVYIAPGEEIWQDPQLAEPLPDKERNQGGAHTPRCPSCDTPMKVSQRTTRAQEIHICPGCGDRHVLAERIVNEPLPITFQSDDGGGGEQGLQLAEPCLEEGETSEEETETPAPAGEPEIEPEPKPCKSAEPSVYTCGVDVMVDGAGAEIEAPQVAEPCLEIALETVEPPEALRDLPVWACHHEKVPYNVAKPARSPQKAKSDDMTTWASYEKARAEYEASQSYKYPYDGIGFFCPGEYVVIDLDHCRNLLTGEITEQAREIIATFASYAEISFSGTGVHIIVRAVLLRNIKRPGVEMYDHGRFMTYTGQLLPGCPYVISSRQAEIDALFQQISPPALTPKGDRQPEGQCVYAPSHFDDEEVITKAGRASNGMKFRDLMAGSWESYGYKTRSEADQALCAMLAYWTDGDVAQIERLFKQSGLYREDRWYAAARAGETYGEGTIKRALGYRGAA